MYIYILTFLLVIVLSYIIEKIESKNKPISYILVFLIVIVLSILGGLRDNSVGTDINVYGERWFEYATKAVSLSDYISTISTSDTGYLVINYIVSRFTNDFNIFLFVLQLICNGLIISTLYKYRKQSSFTLAILIFICLFYFRTYNYLRQSIALAIIFWGFTYVKDKKIIKYIIVVGIAAQFHFTAYVAITIYLIYMLLNSKIKNKEIITGIIIIGTFICTINIINIINVLYSINLVSYRIYEYILLSARESVDFSLIETILKIILILFTLINFKVLNKKENINLSLLIMIIMDVIFFQMRSIILYTDRFALYYGYFIMLLLSQVPKSFKEKNNSEIINLAIVIFLIGFCIFKFIFENSGQIYPYTSIILGIYK